MKANESSFWRYKICANILGGSPGRGRQTTVGLQFAHRVQCGVVDNGNFQRFRYLFFRYFRDEASVVMAICSPSLAFQWSQNAWPWITLTCYFTLNSVFAPVWLAETVRLRKIIAWNLMKIDTYCQRCKSSAGTLVSGNIRFVRIFGRVL